MSLETNIMEISLDQLDQIFQENPEAIPTADSLAVGTEEESTPTPPVDTSTGIDSIEDAPEDIFDEKETEEEDKEEGQEQEDTKEPEDDEDEDASDPNTIKDVLTNTVDYLIKEGIWVDFEGREGLEVTPEVWADLSAKQAQHNASAMFNELVDETGDYGKAILSYVKNGGDPNQIIDLFKEQKSIEAIDTSSEEGKQAKIESYYTDVLNWKPDRVKRHVNRLVENNEIDEEFEIVEEAYGKHYQDKLNEIQEEQRQEEQRRIDKQKEFVNSIKSALDENANLTNKEKQIIASSILDFKHKLNNGQKVNDFYLRFAEVQSDPKEYVELVQFIMNKEDYLTRIRKQEETKANKKAFNFIKGNASVSKPSSQNVSINKSSKRTGTDFSFLINKNK